MAKMQPALVAPSSPEELRLAADVTAERLRVQLGQSPVRARWLGSERRHERRWIREAQRGSGAALEALYRRHWPWAHRTAYLIVHDRAAAEDIAQEAFLAALHNLDRFDRRRPFGPWLHRIVVNRAIDWSRARALRRELSEVPGSEDFDTGDLGTFSEGVAAGLASLPPEQRAVIVLRYLLEYTPGEIADLLELPRGTVNSRLRRGLDRLEAIVDREQR